VVVWFVVVVRYVCVGLCVWCGCIVAGSYPVFFFNEMKRSSPALSRKKHDTWLIILSMIK
jgi:hypothetical protein